MFFSLSSVANVFSAYQTYQRLWRGSEVSERNGSGKTAWLMIALAVFLMGAEEEGGGLDERAALTDMQQQLHERISAFRAEQEYLLFQNAMYGSDSKYLVFSTEKKQVFLKYKNRVLKDVRFKAAGKFRGDAFRPGPLVLTNKTEGKGGRYTLVFGKSLIVQGKRTAAPPDAEATPVISIPQKDLVSIFYALEAGSMAYIEP